jgi:ABC-2 type transport system ATP-binding protein
MIDVQSLSKRFGQLIAVDAVTFSVGKGEVFGLLGPNGAGKSTAINMMVGALAPDSGTVRIGQNGNPLHPDTRRGIGVAPQALAIYEELSAEENIHFFGTLYQPPEKLLKERVAWALDFVGLTDRKSGKSENFSGGMKRRLNLACALVHDPQLLFFDEPTVGIDPQSRSLMFERIEQLRSQGRTIVYTTHYMEEAQRLCDRVAIIDHGKILDLDTVPNLIAKYGGKAVVTGELEKEPPSSVALPGVRNDLQIRFESTNPFAEVAALNAQGVAFHSLQVTQPDLESVFLSLTGRRLRD